MRTIDPNLLRELLHYNPDTGIFTWRVNKGTRGRAGARAGKVVSSGHRMITINMVEFLEHRLAWLYVYGVLPKNQLDHINTDKVDNRIANLREANDRENQRNRRISKNNTSGFKGVVRTGKKWAARIKCDKLLHLGTFNTPEEAHEAYKAAAEKYFGEFARAA